MAFPATDTFTYSNGQLSTVSGGRWVDLSTQKVQVASNAATYDASAGDGIAYDGSNTWANDHYAQAVLTGTGYPGLGVRLGTGPNGYMCYAAGVPSGNLKIDKETAGSRTNLASLSLVSGHTGYLSAVGTTIEFKDNTVSQGTVTDSAFASGKPGLFMYNGGSATADLWEADNIPTGAGGGPTVAQEIPSFVQELSGAMVGTVDQ